LEIVKRSQTAKGFALVRKRWIVERTFAWLYQRRRLMRDYEKRIDHSEAFIYIAMIGLMTKRLALAKL
jgi:putative transposase